MRNWFLVFTALVFCTVAAAQTLTITTVYHEPGESEVGPYIAAQREPNPHFDPLQPNGEPEEFPVYGNGKGYANELDDISSELYAIGGTTTHDLVELTNNTGNDIRIDVDVNSANALAWSFRPKRDVEDAPEQATPDPTAQHTFIGFEDNEVVVPNGTSRKVWLFRTRWGPRLDTSPRDYIVTFEFRDLNSGTDMTVEADLWVPDVGGQEGSSCVVTSDGGLPTGLWIIAAGGVAAIASRRKELKRARNNR